MNSDKLEAFSDEEEDEIHQKPEEVKGIHN
jgi:hypothetical protein